MAKYIDAEKLIAEIERWRDQAKEDYNESTYSMGRCDALAEFRNHIVSLQQEQPKVEFEDKFAKFIEKKDAELGANTWSEEDLRELALYFYYGRNEDNQPEVNLEKEIRSMWKKCNPTDEGMGVESTYMHIEAFDIIARYFYELGLKARKKETK